MKAIQFNIYLPLKGAFSDPGVIEKIAVILACSVNGMHSINNFFYCELYLIRW